MAKMKALQPEMVDLKELHKDDKDEATTRNDGSI